VSLLIILPHVAGLCVICSVMNVGKGSGRGRTFLHYSVSMIAAAVAQAVRDPGFGPRARMMRFIVTNITHLFSFLCLLVDGSAFRHRTRRLQAVLAAGPVDSSTAAHTTLRGRCDFISKFE
jgi:hypothetical protein